MEKICNSFSFVLLKQGFDYVVAIKTGQKICFGSTVPRSTDYIGKGLSSFQKLKQPELFKSGPGSYQTEKCFSALYPLLNKIQSKKGVGPLASKDKRFKEQIMRTPSPGRYEISQTINTKPSFAPFGAKAEYKTNENNNPGAATYDIRKIKKCRRTRFMNNFGNPKMIYAVETLCIPVPVDTCHKCNELCQGDYWRKDYAIFLCHLCWEEERYTKEVYTKEELKGFEKIRNCSFMHDHEGTDAALLKIHPNKIKKKIRLENYLNLYIDR